jgi:hypothetical protein
MTVLLVVLVAVEAVLTLVLVLVGRPNMLEWDLLARR